MCSDAEGPGSKLCILSTQTLSCEYICSHLSGDASEQADTRENTGLLLHCMNARTLIFTPLREKNINVVFSDAVDCLPKTPFYEGTFRKTKDTSHISKKVFDEFRWSEARAVTS